MHACIGVGFARNDHVWPGARWAVRISDTLTAEDLARVQNSGLRFRKILLFWGKAIVDSTGIDRMHLSGVVVIVLAQIFTLQSKISLAEAIVICYRNTNYDEVDVSKWILNSVMDIRLTCIMSSFVESDMPLNGFYRSTSLPSAHWTWFLPLEAISCLLPITGREAICWSEYAGEEWEINYCKQVTGVVKWAVCTGLWFIGRECFRALHNVCISYHFWNLLT